MKADLNLRQDVNADTSQIGSVRRRLAFGKKNEIKKRKEKSLGFNTLIETWTQVQECLMSI